MNNEPDLRCSVITAGLGEQPGGSAGGADRYVLVELPLPWPKKIDQHPLLAEVAGPTTGVSVTVLGIRSNDSTEIGSHRVICYERSVPYRGFERAEFVVPGADLTEIISLLVTQGAATTATEHAARVDIPDEVEDLLICTHGSRDRCCGQLGTRLHAELDCALPGQVRMWRTSHTGGHRFAPTGIHFPTGTTWAYLDAELTEAIVTRSIETSRLGRHFRGNVGISGRAAQLAEGLTFLDQGWTWLDRSRQVEVFHHDEEIEAVVSADGVEATFSMVETQALPVPICGEGIDNAEKSTPQLRATRRS